jgi:hypothetical protein
MGLWRNRLSGVRHPRSFAAATIGLCVALVVVGCSDATDIGAGDSNLVVSQFSLSLPSGSGIFSVNYRVLSSGSATLTAGAIDVSNPGASLSLDLTLPPGTGDVVQLSAQTGVGASCAGTSPPFDVTPGQPTFVGLTLICGGDQPGSSHCPNVRSWGVTPLEASVPVGSISVGVMAAAPEAGDVLSYAWVATAGAFLDPSAGETSYVCTTAGPQTLTLTLRDQQSSPTCAATASFLVSCLSHDDAGSPKPPSVVSAPIPDWGQ